MDQKRTRAFGGSRRIFGLVVALILLLNYDAVSSVEVHFESKDGGFFLKHSPRTFYPTNLRPEYTPSTPSGSSSSSTGSSGATSGSSGSTTVSSSSMPGGPRLEPGNSVLSVDKFTVFQTSEPVSVRATYGPFSTKQTVPARYIVPDLLDSLPASSTDPKKINGTGGLTSKTLVDVQELGARHLDMSAHIVNPSIPRDAPVLRVLFHAGSEATGRRQSILGRQQRVCVLLHGTPSVQPNSRNRDMESLVAGPLTATCSPDGQDGVCLAQITVPASWWPPLPPPDTAGRIKPVKTLPRIVQLSYSVMEPRTTDDAGHTLDSSSAAFCQPKVQIQPLTPLGQVTLAPNRATYKELKTDEYLTLLVPHGPLYPRSRLHIPVFLQSHSSKQATQNRPPVAAVVLRARVKAGVKILDASTSSPDWVIESDINLKNTAATFTARRKENVSRLPNASAEEIMTMLLEASEESTESKEHGGGGRIVWSVRYALEGEEDNVSLAGPFQATQPHYHHHNNGHSSDRKKLQAHLEIQKDDIQAVLPISKNWEVMNTAVLTGRQISQAMKVFIVSQAGTVADVTLQSSCHSEDESVLKVSTSCSSVYVDGSELRGSSNASVLVKYGTYTGLAQFTTWMPEFPLEVSVTDTRLNQIKGWKVPEEHHLLAKNKRSLNATDEAAAVAADASDKKRSTPSDVPDKEDDMDYEEEDIEEADVDEEDGEDLTEGKMRFRSGDKWDEINSIDRGTTSTNCRLRFQQSPVEVHARFKAEDLNSGRVSYFVNRRTWLRVTDLVAGLLRVSDPRIATLLQGRIVQGKGIGRTEVQVLSPINGRVIGAKELRVGNDRVSVSQLSVKVVTGIQLTISPDSAIENGYIAETSVTRKLTAKYQEGLLDIDIEFSDGSRTPLRDISVSDYHLGVESLDTEVVAFAPMAASHHPRVIAVGEGRGDLLRISLQLADVCRQSPNRRSKSSVSRPATAPAANPPPALPLATATAHVEVDFDSSELPSRPEFVQNDGGVGLGGHHRERKNGRDLAPDLHDILIGGMGGVGVRHSSHNSPRMTPLEIGMYVLLAAFCFAIVVFLVGCVVIASKLKPQPSEGNGAPGSGLPNIPVLEAARAAASQFSQNRRARESTTNAHDWVWLGRATLDACGPQQVRVTRNPLAGEPEDETMDLASSFDNPNHIELPTRNKRSGPIDSTTYCKRDRQRNLAANRPLLNNDNDNDSPPPLPPHNASASWSENGNVAEDYKPPIPPHRNTSNGLTRMPDTPKRRHHHQRASSNGGDHAVGGRRHESSKHHHHRVSKSGRSKSNSSNNSNSNSNGNNSNGSSSGSGKLPIDVVNENGSADLAYVEVRNRDPEARSKRARSREKKRATVVGNPMFSSTSSNSSDSPTHAANDNQGLHLHHENETQQSNTNATTSSTGLDDLNLGMDYNQIMQYFENLKESNA